MICENCGKKIDRLRVNTFFYDGSDYWNEIMIEECEKEMRDTITCPVCKKWPFRSQELQIHEPVVLVMFKEKEGE